MNNTTQFLSDIAKNKYLSNLPSFKEKKAQEITTITLTLITLCLFGIFAINPTLSTIAQLKRELIDNEETDRKLELKIKNIGLLQQNYSAIQKDLPVIFAAVPKTPEATLLTAQLQEIAARTSVTIVRSQIFQVDLPKQKNPGTKTSTTFSFAITAEGQYSNIVDFMKELTNFERIVNLENIAISAGPDGSGQVQLNIRGKAYFKL